METGGILLGRPTNTGATVDAVVGPGPDATHARHSFTPDSEWQAAQVALAWRQDPGLHYLGDWHTHPGGTTRFSALDHDTAKTIAAYTAARQPEPFMLVAALGHNASACLGCAQLHRGRLRHVTLKVLDETHTEP